MSIQKHSLHAYSISFSKFLVKSTSDHTSQNISCYEIQLDHLKSSDRRKMIIDRAFNELTDRENAILTLWKEVGTHVYLPACIFLGGPGDNRRPRCLSAHSCLPAFRLHHVPIICSLFSFAPDLANLFLQSLFGSTIFIHRNLTIILPYISLFYAFFSFKISQPLFIFEYLSFYRKKCV